MPFLISDCDRLRDMMDFKTSLLSSALLWEMAYRKSIFEENIGRRLSVGHRAHMSPDCFLHLTGDQWLVRQRNCRTPGSSVFCLQAVSPHRGEEQGEIWFGTLHLLLGDHLKLLTSFDRGDRGTTSFFFSSAQTSIMLSIFKIGFPSLIWK